MYMYVYVHAYHLQLRMVSSEGLLQTVATALQYSKTIITHVMYVHVHVVAS